MHAAALSRRAALRARIDRLIAPHHHLASLIVLRMTFAVDLLSYVLGLFSHKTTWSENAVSTAIGGAPFALLFAFFPALPLSLQLAVFALSALAFGAYVVWVMRHAPALRHTRWASVWRDARSFANTAAIALFGGGTDCEDGGWPTLRGPIHAPLRPHAARTRSRSAAWSTALSTSLGRPRSGN